MARPRTDIKERIVHAARREFLARGVEATALRAIARRARTNLGMVYYYFPTKEELFLAVIEEPYGRLVSAMGEILGGQAPVRARVRSLYRRIAAFTPEEGDTFRLVLAEALKSPRLRARVFARAWRGHLPIVFAAIEEGQRGGALDGSSPPALLGIVTAAVGLLPQIAARATPLGLEAGDALADRLTDLLFDGIGGGPSAPRRRRRAPAARGRTRV